RAGRHAAVRERARVHLGLHRDAVAPGAVGADRGLRHPRVARHAQRASRFAAPPVRTGVPGREPTVDRHDDSGAAAGAGGHRPVMRRRLLLFRSVGYFAAGYFCSTTARLRTVMALYMATAALIALYGIYQLVAAVDHVPFVAVRVQSYFGIAASFRPNATFRE